MAAILREVHRVQNLVGGSIAVDHLNTILCGICDLLNQQQMEINDLRSQLEERPTKSEIEISSKVISNRILAVENKYKDDNTEFQRSMNALRREMSSLEKSMQLNAQQTDANFDEFTNSNRDQVQSLSMLQNQTAKAMGDRVTKVEILGNEINERMDVIREMFDQIGLSTIEKLSVRLNNIDNEISKANENNERNWDELNKTRETWTQRDINLRKEIDKTLHVVRKDINDIQDRMLSSQPEEIGPEGQYSEDMLPIIRGIRRNSRRLDGFDETISGVRIECENVSEAMSNTSEILQQFNHCIYDAGLDVEDLKSYINTKLTFVQQWVKFSSGVFEALWASLMKLTKAHEHLANSTSASLDTTFNTISSMASHPIPNINGLDGVIVESNGLSDHITHVRSMQDISKRMVTVTSGLSEKKGEFTLRRTKPMDIPKFDRKMAAFTSSALVQSALENVMPKASSNEKHDPMVMMAIEEMRTKTNILETTIKQFTENVESKVHNIASEVESKMESRDANRMLEKMHRTMSKLQKNVDIVCDNLASNNHTYDAIGMEPRRAISSIDSPKPQANRIQRPKTGVPSSAGGTRSRKMSPPGLPRVSNPTEQDRRRMMSSRYSPASNF